MTMTNKELVEAAKNITPEQIQKANELLKIRMEELRVKAEQQRPKPEWYDRTYNL